MSINNDNNNDFISNSYRILLNGVKDGKSSPDNQTDWSIYKRIAGGILLLPVGLTHGVITGVKQIKNRFEKKSSVSKADSVGFSTINALSPLKKLENGFSKMKACMEDCLRNHNEQFIEKYVNFSQATDANLLDLSPSNPYLSSDLLELEMVSAVEERPKGTYEWSVDVSFLSEGQARDVSLEQFLPNGMLMGSFHGVENKEIAKIVAGKFKESFSETLSKNKGDVCQTFEEVFQKIYSEVAENFEGLGDRLGSTIVLSYVEQNSGLIYTATMGDNQANIYRKIENEWKTIPLSDNRPAGEELNITVCRCKEGDILVFNGHGLREHVDEHEIVNCIANNEEYCAEDITNELIDLAVNRQPEDSDQMYTVGVVRIVDWTGL